MPEESIETFSPPVGAVPPSVTGFFDPDRSRHTDTTPGNIATRKKYLHGIFMAETQPDERGGTVTSFGLKYTTNHPKAMEMFDSSAAFFAEFRQDCKPVQSPIQSPTQA